MEKKEAMKILKDFRNKSALFSVRTALDTVFPELAESEDEKIRNAIIATIHLYYGEPLEDEAKEMIAWLEKQGNNVNIDIESMVSQYKQRLKSQGGVENIHIVDMCLTAFRHGVENVLEELNLEKLEKQGGQHE